MQNTTQAQKGMKSFKLGAKNPRQAERSKTTLAAVTWLPAFRQVNAATSTTVTTLRFSFGVIWGGGAGVGTSQRLDEVGDLVAFKSVVLNWWRRRTHIFFLIVKSF